MIDWFFRTSLIITAKRLGTVGDKCSKKPAKFAVAP